MKPLVGIIMGSTSDWETMRHAVETLEELNVPFEAEVVSAHRTPDKLFHYAEEAEGRGIEVIIAGAGGAAHLPGMTASKTALPVLGVPVQSKALSHPCAQEPSRHYHRASPHAQASSETAAVDTGTAEELGT